MISVTSLVATIAHQLEKKYSSYLSRQYAWWLIEALTGITKTSLLSKSSIKLSLKDQNQLDSWIYQLVYNDMPLQYIIGSVPFGECTILVEPPTLIPRPETEIWCMELIEQCKKFSHQSFSILDIGTGSGCIAIAFAKAFPNAEIYAVDISRSALQLAIKNAKHNKVNNITFLESDLFSALDKDKYFDLIVSNPPYICPLEKPSLDKSVCKWEDEHALFAADNGLSIIQKILLEAPYHLRIHQELTHHNIPQVAIEIGKDQAKATESLFAQNGFSNIVINTDLQGYHRVVSGRLNEEKFE